MGDSETFTFTTPKRKEITLKVFEEDNDSKIMVII
jgi:hypothetical protein